MPRMDSPAAPRVTGPPNTPPVTPSVSKGKNKKRVASEALPMTPPPSSKKRALPIRLNPTKTKTKSGSENTHETNNRSKENNSTFTGSVQYNRVKKHRRSESSKSSLSSPSESGRMTTRSMSSASTPSKTTPGPLTDLPTPMTSPSPAPRKSNEPKQRRLPKINIVGNWRSHWIASKKNKRDQSPPTEEVIHVAQPDSAGHGGQHQDNVSDEQGDEHHGMIEEEGRLDDDGGDEEEETDMDEEEQLAREWQAETIKLTQNLREDTDGILGQTADTMAAHIARRQTHLARLYLTGDPGFYVLCADGPFLRYFARCHMADLQHAAIRDFLQEHVMTPSDFGGLMAWYDYELGEPERRAERLRARAAERLRMREAWMREALKKDSVCLVKTVMSRVKVKLEDDEEQEFGTDHGADACMEDDANASDSEAASALLHREGMLTSFDIKQEPE